MIEFGHRLESPFPKKKVAGKTVIDEVCTCGILRSMHEDKGGYGFGAAFSPNGLKCKKFAYGRNSINYHLGRNNIRNVVAG